MALKFQEYQDLLKNLHNDEVIARAKMSTPRSWMAADELLRREEVRSAKKAEMEKEDRSALNVVEEIVARASSGGGAPMPGPAGPMPAPHAGPPMIGAGPVAPAGNMMPPAGPMAQPAPQNVYQRGGPVGANGLSQMGRGGDTELMHVSPSVVNRAATGVNPETGLPEAVVLAPLLWGVAGSVGAWVLQKLATRYGPAAAKKMLPGAMAKLSEKRGVAAAGRTARAAAGRPTAGESRRQKLADFFGTGRPGPSVGERSGTRTGRAIKKGAQYAGKGAYYGGAASLASGLAPGDDPVDEDIEMVFAENPELFGSDAASPEYAAAVASRRALQPRGPSTTGSGVSATGASAEQMDGFQKFRDRYAALDEAISATKPDWADQLTEQMGAFGGTLATTPGDFGVGWGAASQAATEVPARIRQEERATQGERVALVAAESNLEFMLMQLAINAMMARARATGGRAVGKPLDKEDWLDMVMNYGIPGVDMNRLEHGIASPEFLDTAVKAYHRAEAVFSGMAQGGGARPRDRSTVSFNSSLDMDMDPDFRPDDEEPF